LCCWMFGYLKTVNGYKIAEFPNQVKVSFPHIFSYHFSQYQVFSLTDGRHRARFTRIPAVPPTCPCHHHVCPMSVQVQALTLGKGNPLALIAGPCVVESRELILRTAEQVRSIADRHGIPVIFKSSYRKANRTSAQSFTGIGMEEALRILADVKQRFGMAILTDIHTEEEAAAAASVADVLQIPAFLCRQTELLQAAGRTGRVVNIKKGQFLAPGDMRHAAEKVALTGNLSILLTERGTTFGYHDLVVDMRGLAVMRETGYPVVLDVTHAVQRPGGEGTRAQTGGQPEFIFPLARAGVAAGIDALFVEVHPDPPHALSDAATQLPLDRLDSLLREVVLLDRVVRDF
jgi:2-dehydro-3-deoxyphosphooctonate aldolase (KDO 8-P synthase)